MSLSHSEVVDEMLADAVAYGRDHGVPDDEIRELLEAELGGEDDESSLYAGGA